MIEVEVHAFIAVERIGSVIVAFSNKPYCEFSYSLDEGIIWTIDKRVSKIEGEVITSPWQVCSDELGYIYLGTSKGNIYRGRNCDVDLGWVLVENVLFADNDPILYVKLMNDGCIFAASEFGNCIHSLNGGETWDYIQMDTGTQALDWRGKKDTVMLVEFTEENVKRYLDACITRWRKMRDNNDNRLGEIAMHYIDAYQSMRSSLFGKLLAEK